jgi:hypothetical protein
MPLQSSGAISLNQIHIEAGGTSGTTVSLNDSDIRSLGGVASGAIDFADFYGASAGPVDFNNFTYQAERRDQGGYSVSQYSSVIDTSFASSMPRLAFRVRLSSGVLYYEVKKGAGSNGVRADGNSSGVQDGTTTAITTTYLSIGSMSVPSPVDVKINWSSNNYGTSGASGVIGHGPLSSSTYALSDNVYQTLTDGQSAGLYVYATTTRTVAGSQSRTITGILPLTVQKTGYTTEEVATIDFSVIANAQVLGFGGCPLCCIHEDILLDTTRGPMSIHDINKVQVYSWNFQENKKEVVDIEEVVIVERDCVYKINNLLLTEDHILFTEEGAPVAINPEEVMRSHNKYSEQVVVGQKMKLLEGSEEITSIEKYPGTHKVYAVRTKNNNFYANGILVDAYL